jgi:1-acyl-sn-glycerol-3-phosphate acyltransferase
MRFFKIIRGALIFTAFYVGGAFFGAFVLPVVSAWPSPEGVRLRRNHRIVSAGFRFVLDLLRWARIFDFNARKADSGLPDHPIVVIVNHPTTIDVVAVLSVYRDAVVVIKDKIWNDPFLRFVFRWLGHIRGGDGSIPESMRVMAEVETRLNQGFSVVIFPEGTRSPARGLAPMMKGAFAIATRAGTDLLPVVITSDPPALNRDEPWHHLPNVPVVYRLRPLPLVSARNTSARKLQTEITAIYERALNLPPTGKAKAPSPASPRAPTSSS